MAGAPSPEKAVAAAACMVVFAAAGDLPAWAAAGMVAAVLAALGARETAVEHGLRARARVRQRV
jgi:hypothetical protein